MSEIPALKSVRAILAVSSGGHANGSISLDRPRLIIGRELDCGLKLVDPQCSRHHAAILCDAYTIRVRDLGSEHGTFVNGTRIGGTVVLNVGDTVQIGDTAMLLQRNEGPRASTAPVPLPTPLPQHPAAERVPVKILF